MTDSPRWTVIKRERHGRPDKRGPLVVAGRYWSLDEANRKATALRREGYRAFVVKTRKDAA
jgi:cell division septation protein DedD